MGDIYFLDQITGRIEAIGIKGKSHSVGNTIILGIWMILRERDTSPRKNLPEIMEVDWGVEEESGMDWDGFELRGRK